MNYNSTSIQPSYPSPGPTDVSEVELQPLAQHYLDPSTGHYNYLRFHADIKTLKREEEGS